LTDLTLERQPYAPEIIRNKSTIRLHESAIVYEPGHLLGDAPYTAEALANAFQQAMATTDAPIDTIYSSENGEMHYTKELSVALLRQQHRLNTHRKIYRPAEYFGDFGAAFAPVAIGLASATIQAYPEMATLVYASSDGGPRGALCLSANPDYQPVKENPCLVLFMPTIATSVTRAVATKPSPAHRTCAKLPWANSTPPIPYGISSQASDLAQTTTSVLIDGNPTAIASSIHTQCSGDQAGSASGTVADKTQVTSYSFDVKAEGEGVVRHMDMTTMNNGNTIGTNYGAATAPVAFAEEEDDLIYTLCFQVIDELGQPLKRIAYKVLPAGNRDALHQADGKTDSQGKTPIVSTEKNEGMGFYFVWAELKTNNTSEG